MMNKRSRNDGVPHVKADTRGSSSAKELMEVEATLSTKATTTTATSASATAAPSSPVNESFFRTIDTELKAFWLGWVASNTHLLAKNQVRFSMNAPHRRTLEGLRQSLCPTVPLIKKGDQSIYLVVHSSQIAQDIRQHLHVSSDAQMTRFPQLSHAPLMWAFFRGYFDSDGTIAPIQPRDLNQIPRCSVSFPSERLMNEFVEFSGVKGSAESTLSNEKKQKQKEAEHDENHDDEEHRADGDSEFEASPFRLSFSGTNAVDLLSKLYENAQVAIFSNRDLAIDWLMWTPGLSSESSDSGSLPECRWVKAHPDAVPPTKARASDIGYDLTIIRTHKKWGNRTVLYDTGIKIQPGHGLYAEIVPRSSLSKSGYILANSVGIIDPCYTGNLYVALTKVDDDKPDISFPFVGTQIIFRRYVSVNLTEVKGIDETERASGGFGSTEDKKMQLQLQQAPQPQQHQQKSQDEHKRK